MIAKSPEWISFWMCEQVNQRLVNPRMRVVPRVFRSPPNAFFIAPVVVV
jgi:hypothetical protein